MTRLIMLKHVKGSLQVGLDISCIAWPISWYISSGMSKFLQVGICAASTRRLHSLKQTSAVADTHASDGSMYLSIILEQQASHRPLVTVAIPPPPPLFDIPVLVRRILAIHQSKTLKGRQKLMCDDTQPPLRPHKINVLFQVPARVQIGKLFHLKTKNKE